MSDGAVYFDGVGIGMEPMPSGWPHPTREEGAMSPELRAILDDIEALGGDNWQLMASGIPDQPYKCRAYFRGSTRVWWSGAGIGDTFETAAESLLSRARAAAEEQGIDR